MAGIWLEWGKDRDGYKAVRRSANPGVGRASRLLGDGSGDFIVRAGGKMISTYPFSDPTGLIRRHPWRVLADMQPTPAGALAFVSEFGFLFQANAKEERVSEIVDAIRNMRTLLDLGKQRQWPRIQQWLDESKRETLGIGGVGRLGLLIDWREGMERPTVRFRPGNLRSGLYAQAVLDLTDGVDLKKCRLPGCMEFFGVGPPLGRRKDAEYCSLKHQKAHDYQMRKGGSK